jgi:NDP-sugar pyrophosphorylase family protein
MTNKNISLVYMVAGISSRFGGRIKAMAKVGPNGETLIEYSLSRAITSGFSKIVFVVGEATKEPFQKMFGDNFRGVPVEYVEQTFDPAERDKPWGTGQAVAVLKECVYGSFVVCNGDDIYGANDLKTLYDHLSQSEDAAIIGYRLSENLSEKGTSNRGVIYHNENGQVTSLREVLNIDRNDLVSKDLSPETLVSMNLFALPNMVIDEMNKRFQSFKDTHPGDRKTEFMLPMELSDMIEKNELQMTVYSAVEKTIGLTYPEDEEIVRNQLANK